MAALLIIATVLLAGCGARTRSQAASAEQAQTAAKSALLGYLEGRRAGDLARAYTYLSGPSQALYSQQEFVGYYGQFPRLEWQRVGKVTMVAEDWARIVVYDITSISREGQRNRLADFAYYVHRKDGRWGVAVLNPAMARLNEAEGPEGTLQAARPLLKANPYSSQVHRELYYAFLAGGDPAQAEAELNTLFQVSSPSDLAGLQVMWSQLHLVTDQPERAAKAADTAIKLALAYPETYGSPWRSSVLTTLAQAHLALGDEAAARSALQQAIQLNPENLDAGALLQGLSRPKT